MLYVIRSDTVVCNRHLLRSLENATSNEKTLITKFSVVEKLLDVLQNAKENKVIELCENEI